MDIVDALNLPYVTSEKLKIFNEILDNINEDNTLEYKWEHRVDLGVYNVDDIIDQTSWTLKDIVEKSVQHFNQEILEAIYIPSKTFYVAILYAFYLASIYNVDPYELLKRNDLLTGDSSYKPYVKSFDVHQMTVNLVYKGIFESVDYSVLEPFRGTNIWVLKYLSAEFKLSKNEIIKICLNCIKVGRKYWRK